MSKKVILIGATSGIGRSLAEMMSTKNYNVALTGIEEDIVNEIQHVNSNNLYAQYLDCTSDRNSEVINTLIENLKGLDILIFSAGIGHLDQDLGHQVENEANQLNVLAFTEIADKCYRYFAKQGYGHFVAITSIAGLRGNRLAPAYHAAKSYQISYLEGLQQKASRENIPIYITDVRPGFVDTGLANKRHFWMASKEQAARQIISLIERKKDIGYVTKRWCFIAFLLNIIPHWLYKRL